MQINKLSINGVYTIQPTIFKDNRGYFFESYNSKKYRRIIKYNFLQDDHSFSKKNVLRGIHFQYKRPQAQLFYLAKGKIYLAIVDFRPRSKTFLRNETIILDSKKHLQVFTPPGVGSGFYSLDKENHLIYKISELFVNDKNEMGILWDDKTLNIKWPCNIPNISQKDKNNKKISDINFNEYKDLINL